MWNLIIAVAIASGVYFWLQENPDVAARIPIIGTQSKYELQLEDALASQSSNIQVRGEGRVIEVLEPEAGRPHQAFLLQLDSGDTLILDHNIEFAQAISSPRVGDKMVFFGEFDWTSRGGVVHSTHDDPAGLKMAGWIKHMGRTYD